MENTLRRSLLFTRHAKRRLRTQPTTFDFQRLEPRQLLAFDLATTLLPTTETSDFHSEGWSVETNGAIHVTGKPGFSLAGSSTGAIEIYDSNSNEHLFTVPNPLPNDYPSFGRRLALAGDRIAVGAWGGVFVYEIEQNELVLDGVFAAPGGNGANGFGVHTIGFDGQYLIVGEPFHDDGATTDVGIAHVFDTLDTAGTPIATLTNPTPDAFDYFGWSVQTNGNQLAVGAYADDADGATNSGVVYLYEISNGQVSSPSSLFSPLAATSDGFGRSLELSQDKLAVRGLNSVVHVYDMSQSTPVFMDSIANPGSWIFFGEYMDLDGDTLAVTDFSDDSYTGVAYVFDLSSGSGTLIGTLVDPTPNQDEWFGESIAVNGDQVIVGNQRDTSDGPFSGSAYVYDISGATPMFEADLSQAHVDRAELGAWIDSNSTHVFVGAPAAGVSVQNSDNGYSNGLGEVYVYSKDNGVPELDYILESPNATHWSGFGQQVAASEEYLAVLGSNGFGTGPAGVINIYSFANGVPEFEYSIPGTANQIQVIGNRLFVSNAFLRYAPQNLNFAGGVHVYDLDLGDTSPRDTFFSPAPFVDQRFGVSMTTDGQKLIVGAVTGSTSTGGVYVFDVTSSFVPQFEQSLINPNPTNFDFYGGRTTVEGSLVVASTAIANVGTVYVFDLDSGTNQPVQTIQNPGAMNNRFGSPLSLNGGRLAAGASDGVFVFDLANDEFVLNGSFSDPDNDLTDNFLSSLLVDSHYILIGDKRDNSVYSSAGAVYVIEESQPQLRVTGPGSIGESGLTDAEFTIELIQPAAKDVTFEYSTFLASGDDALPGADFTEVFGSGTISAGDTSFMVSVPIVGDDYLEADESFSLSIFNVAGAEIETSSATAIVIDDETYSLGQQLDFGTNFSPVESGDVGFVQTEYSSQIGLGWLPGANDISLIERPRGDALLRDLAQLRTGEFVVDVPDSQYRVTVNLGAILRGGDNMRLTIDGQVFNLQPAVGPNVVVETVLSSVPDGQINFEFNGLGLLPYFRVAGILVEEVSNRGFVGKHGLTSRLLAGNDVGPSIDSISVDLENSLGPIFVPEFATNVVVPYSNKGPVERTIDASFENLNLDESNVDFWTDNGDLFAENSFILAAGFSFPTSKRT